MIDTLHRQWNLLQLIPRHPRKLGTPELWQRLRERGFTVTKRTVERDLDTLSTGFPILGDGGRPQGWSWSADAPVFDVPGMDPPTALAYQLAEQYLRPLLPPSLLIQLAPHFHQARRVLEAMPDNPLSQWPDRVRVLPRRLPLIAPDIPVEIVDGVCRGLLQGRCLSVRYRSRQKETVQDYPLIHPLGLILRDEVAYLLCRFWRYPNLRQLVLHRFEAVEVLDTPVEVPSDFDLDRYIHDGEAQMPTGGEIELVVQFRHESGRHLWETPLDAEQRLEEIDDDHLLLTARVRDSLLLRWWLQGFGADVEVIAPDHLRQTFAATAQRMSKLYRSTTDID